MADDSTTITSESAEQTTPTAPVGASPAVHSDVLWDGPRWIENATEEPVWVETKQEYWNLLNRTGFKMKDQQESRTGPERDPIDWISPAKAHEPATPNQVLTPFTPGEAETIYAEDAILKRYGLKEALYCETCAHEDRPHGCRVEISNARITVFCRCGTRSFSGPKGTTDLPTSLSHIGRSLNDVQSDGHLFTADGQEVPLQVEWLHPEETKVIQAYFRLMRRYNYAPFFQCSTCHAGMPIRPDTTLQVSVSHDRVALMCHCHILASR